MQRQFLLLDRTGLILDIFAQRAKTSYARNQVQLAQYQYILPRLKGLWTHLERQRGGIGMRGPGEREIETDRRIVRDKISLLKKKLATIGSYGSNFLAVYNCIEISLFSIIYSSFKFSQFTCSSESSTSRFFKLETNSSIILGPINAKEGNFKWIGHAPAMFWLSTPISDAN